MKTFIMESPPSSYTAWSEAFILSEDSGLLLTNSSISSGSMSVDGPNRPQKLFEDSDCDDKSLSQDDSLDGMSDIMCGENFNTLKKGAHWAEKPTSPIEPPPEFQDKPSSQVLDWYSNSLSKQLILKVLKEYNENELRKLKPIHIHKIEIPKHLLIRNYWASGFIPISPCHTGRPHSRSSLGSSRLSSSHNSLSMTATYKVDDSNFITQAVSHDTLTSRQMRDLYNVPYDSDSMYSVPADVVKLPIKPKTIWPHKKRRRNTSSGCKELDGRQCPISKNTMLKSDRETYKKNSKRHSLAGASTPRVEGEPIHMTLEEVRKYLQTLYSSSSDSSDNREKISLQRTPFIITNKHRYSVTQMGNGHTETGMTPGRTKSKSTFLINIKNKKVKDSCDNISKQIVTSPKREDKGKGKIHSNGRLFSIKQAFCNMFKLGRFLSPKDRNAYGSNDNLIEGNHTNIISRALPPLPSPDVDSPVEQALDFATSIQRVKDYGWYWGPLSSEAAEKILSNEPDGSFIVRDSSDDHYIFSLTFKLNDYVRHVRIEHDQGNFSFGSCTKFKSQTIVEFIENAVEHSRSGRYLFFLHRKPVIGPVRVQLLHPVSRFKQVQSLQHMCRFVIHKVVRRDLIPSLPLPRRIIDYLNTRHYYSEHLVDIEESDNEQLDNEHVYRSPARNIPDDEQDVRNVVVAPVPVNDYIVLDNPLADRQS